MLIKKYLWYLSYLTDCRVLCLWVSPHDAYLLTVEGMKVVTNLGQISALQDFRRRVTDKLMALQETEWLAQLGTRNRSHSVGVDWVDG